MNIYIYVCVCVIYIYMYIYIYYTHIYIYINMLVKAKRRCRKHVSWDDFEYSSPRKISKKNISTVNKSWYLNYLSIMWLGNSIRSSELLGTAPAWLSGQLWLEVMLLWKWPIYTLWMVYLWKIYPPVNKHRPWQIGVGRLVYTKNWWFSGSNC